MHVGIVHGYDNILYHEDVVSYYYRIRPINSLFASESQCATLIDDMVKVIQDVNMPGGIIIKPTKIDNNKIYKAYTDNFKDHGNPALMHLAKDYIKSLKEILSSAVRYRYEIYFVFCDGRDEIKKKIPLKLFRSENRPLSKQELELYKTVEKEILKKLKKTVPAQRMDSNDVTALNNYTAVPVDEVIADYYVEENPSEIKYTYKQAGSSVWKTLYSRTHAVSSFQTLKADNSDRADDVINSLQLEFYPSDLFIKFDLEQTSEFKKNMKVKKEKIKKDQKRYDSLADAKDREMSKAELIAKVGEEVDPAIEGSKIKFQMFIRLRANQIDMLNKRSEFLRAKFESKRILLTNEIGAQISMANNLFPYRISFSNYINTTDLRFFARYNFLGGLYIGDEEEGMIISYTVPGGIPIFHDISKPLLGKTKTSAPAIVFVGETGAGKTQLADLEAFQNMIFKGMKVLTVDPKGDREKKIKLLGDNAAHLKIGSKDCSSGMFDPYLMNQNDDREALGQAMRDIDSMLNVLGLSIDTNFRAIEKAHYDMLKDYENRIIHQKTLTYLISEKLVKYDKTTAEQVMTLANDSTMRLFFATQESRYDSAFNLTKPYNLITFEKMPSTAGEKMENDPNRLDNAIFAMLFSRVQGIIDGFMKRFSKQETIVVFDEYKVYQKTPGGEEVVDNVVRQARTLQTHPFLITQELSSISDAILNNVGEIFVGSLKSSKEIEFILEEMKLSNHPAVRGALIDHTQDEGVTEEKKYNFLMQDYNNRKCLTKNKIPRCFAEIFRTLKDEEESNQEQLDTDDKNVPVTGTFLNKKETGGLYDD